jgi:hypothetical protein
MKFSDLIFFSAEKEIAGADFHTLSKTPNTKKSP